MNDSHRFLTNNQDEAKILQALDRESQLARLRNSWSNLKVWSLPLLFLSFDIFIFRSTIASILILSLPFSETLRSAIHTGESTITAICALNCLFYLIDIIGLSFSCFKQTSSNLTLDQVKLFGLSKDNSYASPSQSKQVTSPVSAETAIKRRYFLSKWLSAIRIGNWSMPDKHPGQSHQTRNSLSHTFHSANRSYRSSQSTAGSPNTSMRSDRCTSRSIPLYSKVGTPPCSRPTSSIQTSKQVDEFLQENSFNKTFRSSFDSLSASRTSQHSQLPSNQSFAFFQPSINPPMEYQIGTAYNDDEQAKGARGDENGVVSLITGSQMVVTDKRVSLSPIPLNLLDATNELSSTNGALNVKDTTSGVQRQYSDSISFRVIHNAEKQSPKKTSVGSQSPLLRRSDSLERRRTSLSPKSSCGPFQSGATGIKNVTPTKQIPTGPSDILNEYKINAEYFAEGERRLRIWICQTIIRPLIVNIDKMNDILASTYPQLHLKIGQSLLEALHVALSTKSDLLGTVLPYIMPYLKIHEKQAYIVKRARELADDVCMQKYCWNAGGSERVERSENGNDIHYLLQQPWGEHLPTDAQLIWSWFMVYMDARMTANPLVSDLDAPFSSIYYLKKPCKPTPLHCSKGSFYIYQSSIYPPHFELVIDGARERLDVGRGAKNLWRTMLLFIQHVRLFNNAQIDNLRIDEKGINIACVID